MKEILLNINPEYSTLLIRSMIIAAITVLLVEAIKISYDNIFLGLVNKNKESKKNKPLSAKAKWLINVVCVIMTCFILNSLILKKPEIINYLITTLLYLIMSWSISILYYNLLVKMIFTCMKILYLRIKEFHSSAALNLAQKNLELTKCKNLIIQNIRLSKLENTLEKKTN